MGKRGPDGDTGTARTPSTTADVEQPAEAAALPAEGVPMPTPRGVRQGHAGDPLVIGHRGLPRTFAENHMQGLLAAIQSGADGVELDVRVTRDEVPVVIHDEDLHRTHNLKRLVRELRVDELPSDVTRLEELLEEVRLLSTEAIVDVELKVPLHPSVLDAILPDPDMRSQIVVTSFDPATVRRYVDDGRFRAGILLRRHPFSKNIVVRAKPSALQAALGYITSQQGAEVVRRRVRSVIGATVRETGAKLVVMQDPGSVALNEARRVADDLGLRLWVWTVNRKAQWRRARRYGADGIITDVADRAKAFLEAERQRA